MIGGLWREAAEHDVPDAARRRREFGHNGADRNARGEIGRKPIDAGRDRGE